MPCGIAKPRVELKKLKTFRPGCDHQKYHIIISFDQYYSYSALAAAAATSMGLGSGV